MAALVWTAIDMFGIPWEEMLDLFLGTLLVMGLAIGFAAVTAVLWMALRKLLHKDS